MDNFQQLIADWETFYLLTGTAAATLIGLLFVAVSINIETFRGRVRLDLQHFATLTFNCFFYVLLVSMLFLVPRLTPQGVGVPLLLLGSLGLANALIQQGRARRIQANQRDTGIASRFTVPILSLLGTARA